MKKLIFFILPLFMLPALFQNVYARSPYISYEVVEIQQEGILAKDHKGKLHLIRKDPGDIKVGEIIRYDYIRDRLKKSPWQLAKIVEMTDSSITLQLKTGQNAKVNMRARYRTEFSQGEEVFYKETTNQLIKSNFAEVDEE
jgi:hypothetical protein